MEEGIIDEVGGVSEALFWLHQEIERSRKKRQEKNDRRKMCYLF